MILPEETTIEKIVKISFNPEFQTHGTYRKHHKKNRNIKQLNRKQKWNRKRKAN